MTTGEARLRAQIAAHESWARTPNRSDRTAPARRAQWQRYLERAAEIAGADATAEDIAARAEQLRTADMRRLALAGVRARKARKEQA